MSEYARPKVVVSRCLGFADCRWNGETINDAFVTKLAQFVEYTPVCPEMEIGLGVPRDPIRLVDSPQGVRLVQPAGGRDVTREMDEFCASFLGGLKEVDGFVLKGRSPSCGPVDVRIYTGPEKGASARRGAGFFGRAVQDAFPQTAVEHEGRVHNFQIREHFLTKLFTLASFRSLGPAPKAKALHQFQARNKLLFMAYNQTELRKLGRVIANLERKPDAEVYAEYREGLLRLLKKGPNYTSNINVLMHAMGYFKKDLNTLEKAQFLDSLERYRAGKLPLSALLTLLSSWVARFEEPYLAQQTFFAPYPLELVEITDSGKGRDL